MCSSTLLVKRRLGQGVGKGGQCGVYQASANLLASISPP